MPFLIAAGGRGGMAGSGCCPVRPERSGTHRLSSGFPST